MEKFFVSAENDRGRAVYFEVTAPNAVMARDLIMIDCPELDCVTVLDDEELSPYIRQNAEIKPWREFTMEEFIGCR